MVCKTCKISSKCSTIQQTKLNTVRSKHSNINDNNQGNIMTKLNNVPNKHSNVNDNDQGNIMTKLVDR